ncbi:SDR family NAD(P)-dependent oxidoreductase [Dactylosporangium aurantiacum]|uniref:SDR family NAD(P)-dependent oxidoreductase n=1 Tax=Dactylosporangium aurantiacum TaxID=35754 RepID=A0A9Q9IRR5_9ACTN|nr:SDR family NAD(P)-dependent oxidoreductase [Dactylosporangium aurantiacum]MDG6103309.1 SDR family NAD(P)-dependent oxidoreductase [Dactylosporangium aurantiacum]UWZ57808.1 SDR family NAD(P)-dependent oxidoreductase [Dactylosporangium aurantiacum]
MRTVLVTGSADGIGRHAAAQLIAGGHRVIVHARDEGRAAEAKAALPGAAGVAVGDLGSLAGTVALAGSLEAYGRFDSIVHNAGIARLDSPRRELTGDGLESMFQVNVLAAYLLTALLPQPERLVFLSSAMAAGGAVDLADLQFDRRPWDGVTVYSTTKLLDLMLAAAIARRWPSTLSNALDPGWVRTKMGGDTAPTSPEDAARAEARLAAGTDAAVLVTGEYFTDREWRPDGAVLDPALLEALLAQCADLTGVQLPQDARGGPAA